MSSILRAQSLVQLVCQSNKVSLGTHPTQLLYSIVLVQAYNTSYTKKYIKTKKKENIFNLTVQFLEKYSSPIQQLIYRGWHGVNRQEGLLSKGGSEGGIQ